MLQEDKQRMSEEGKAFFGPALYEKLTKLIRKGYLPVMQYKQKARKSKAKQRKSRRTASNGEL